MKIVLRGGDHDGERTTVPEEAISHHRQRSIYRPTEEIEEGGHRVFRFDRKLDPDEASAE